jgi:hypothetical protein
MDSIQQLTPVQQQAVSIQDAGPVSCYRVYRVLNEVSGQSAPYLYFQDRAAAERRAVENCPRNRAVDEVYISEYDWETYFLKVMLTEAQLKELGMDAE